MISPVRRCRGSFVRAAALAGELTEAARTSLPNQLPAAPQENPMNDTLTRVKGRRHAEFRDEQRKAGIPFPVSARRSVRRAASRDVSRALAGPCTREPARGFFAGLVNTRPPMQVGEPSCRSGQARVNAKRNARAEFWRTVKIRVSVQAEPYFLPSLRLLGSNVRVLGRTMLRDWFAFDYDVHLPGMPAGAVRAEPVYKSVFNGEYHEAQLDYLIWHDADGHAINAETPQQMIEAAS